MWGIIPAAGTGRRAHPLASSKELLPLGSRLDGDCERPKAVSEYLVDRMIRAGATKLCFVISPEKSDLIEHFRASAGPAQICYAVQPRPEGLCDALFRALPLLHPEDEVLAGLPDTVWFPENGLTLLGPGLSFLLFPVGAPERFEAVVTDDFGNVKEIQVRRPGASSPWVWGAFKLTGAILSELHGLWLGRFPRDEHLGTLVNAYLAEGGKATAVRRGSLYLDVGTLDGYREAFRLLRLRRGPGRAHLPAQPVSAR
ncbi:MAG: sugar phosphate nucleotidyltransferase [Myxococcaceae bacterium]